jgi:type II secretory pathway pseudopilin PulG
MRVQKFPYQKIPSQPTPTRRVHAFTIMELIVVIFIISLLVAITIPVLARVRLAARFSSSLSSHRQIMLMLTLYTQDSRDIHPYIVAGSQDHHDPNIDIPIGPNGGLSPGSQSRYWPNLFVENNPQILELIYPPVGFYTSLRDTHNQAGRWQGSFRATSTLFAAPQYFSDSASLNLNQLRPTRTNEITYPSAKMIMFDQGSLWYNTQSMLDASTDDDSILSHTYSFADGSAATIRKQDFDAPYVYRSICGTAEPGHTTLNGLAGRDR